MVDDSPLDGRSPPTQSPIWLIVYPVGAEEGSKVSCPELPGGQGFYTDLRVFDTGIE